MPGNVCRKEKKKAACFSIFADINGCHPFRSNLNMSIFRQESFFIFTFVHLYNYVSWIEGGWIHEFFFFCYFFKSLKFWDVIDDTHQKGLLCLCSHRCSLPLINFCSAFCREIHVHAFNAFSFMLYFLGQSADLKKRKPQNTSKTHFSAKSPLKSIEPSFCLSKKQLLKKAEMWT